MRLTLIVYHTILVADFELNFIQSNGYNAPTRTG